MQSEMEPSRDNQQGAQPYAGYGGTDTNRSDRSIVPAIDAGRQIQDQAAVSNIFTRFIGGYPSGLVEEARLRREDNIWAMINLLMVPFGVLLIVIGVVAT